MKKFVLLFSLLLFVPFFVFAATGGYTEDINSLNTEIQQRKEKIKQIEANIEAYKAKIESARSEAVSLSNQVSLLDNNISQVDLDIQATQQRIEALELEIQSISLQIDEKQKNITQQKAILSELLRTIHYNDKKNYIEIASNYENFSDFYNQVQYVKSVESTVGRQVTSLLDAQLDLQEKRDQREQRNLAFADLKSTLENKKKDLNEQVLAKETLLIQTQSSELTYKTLLQRQRQEYQGIENEIVGIEREIRQKLAEQDRLDKLDVSGNTILSWPTDSRYITARFRDPSYPYRHVFEHNAIDIRSAQGTPVKAVSAGYVARAKTCTVASCYAYVMLIHSGGVSTLYGHLNKIYVAGDQFVQRGEVIGLSGAAPGTVGAGPFTTGPHLHFEVRKNGIPVNPLDYLIRDY